MTTRKQALRVNRTGHPLMAVLAISIGAALSASAQAQEAGRLWTSNTVPVDPQTTEEGVQSKIKEFFTNYPNGAGIPLQVTGHIITPSKAMSKYEGVPLPPVIQPWRYRDFSVSNPPPAVGTVEALEAQIAQRFNQESAGEGCPTVTVIHVSPTWEDGTYWEDSVTAKLWHLYGNAVGMDGKPVRDRQCLRLHDQKPRRGVPS